MDKPEIAFQPKFVRLQSPYWFIHPTHIYKCLPCARHLDMAVKTLPALMSLPSIGGVRQLIKPINQPVNHAVCWKDRCSGGKREWSSLKGIGSAQGVGRCSWLAVDV